MCSVVIKEGRTVEFDVSKICEAVQKAYETLESVFDEIDEMVEEAIDNLGRLLYSFAHSLAHWLLHAYAVFTSRIKKAICFDPYSAIRLTAIIFIRVKLLTVSILGYIHVYRVARLLRTQDRGSDESSDSDVIDFYRFIMA